MDFARFSWVGARFQGQNTLPLISSNVANDITFYLHSKSLFPCFCHMEFNVNKSLLLFQEGQLSLSGERMCTSLA